MDGDNPDIKRCPYNNQSSVYDITSDAMMHHMDDDIQAMNKSDTDYDSADERLGEQYNSEQEKDDTFRKKRKMKFNYVKSRIIDNKNLPENMDVKPVKSIYITSCQTNGKWKRLNLTNLEDQLKAVAKSTIELNETNCGIIILFYDEEDFTRMTKMNLSKVFDTPVAVWNIPHSSPKMNNVILIRDIPWCVKIKEIEDVLRNHGVQPMHSSRIEDGIVRVVVKNSYALPKLVKTGFNFYNCINLPVLIEPQSQLDIVQCYRCQRFWHTAQYCPFFERCVRCGDKHDLKKCTRARNNPNCCLCGDAHHAAYKFCPVRIQHLNAVQVEMNMERE